MRAARPKPPTDLHRICSNSLRLSGACEASSHATPSHGATTLVRKCREWYANASHMIFETYVLCLLPIVVSRSVAGNGHAPPPRGPLEWHPSISISSTTRRLALQSTETGTGNKLQMS